MAKQNIMEASLKEIVVAGDVSIDRYEVLTCHSQSKNNGLNNTYNWQKYPRMLNFTKPGRALLLANFLRSATDTKVFSPELKKMEAAPPEKILYSFVSLDKFPYSTLKEDKKNTVYRVKQYRGFAGPEKGKPFFLSVKDDKPKATMVVLDDAGNGFREAPTVWPAALKKGNQPIVLIKMSSPIAKGPLWEKVQKNHAERMIVVISADDLRQEGVKISRRLSWERTAKEFVWQMACNPGLLALNNCAYLIVRFGLEGAILYTRRSGVVESRLFFDPKIGEDGFGEIYPGNMIGIGSAFVAALASQISRQGFKGVEEGVRQGIISARRLWQLGFGGDPAKLDYPDSDIFKLREGSESPIADIIVPNPIATEPADPEFWCILDDSTQTGLEDVAYDYVIYGRDPVLERVPVGQFHNLRTFDRYEIESFRSIKNLIREYLAAPNINRPLSIAVFGSPGSGKSFGVTEVAEAVAPGKLQKLEFNLSQFNSTEELVAAFHKVRDVALSGKIPIVFFDEFDSEFHGILGWLKYFLAPMQDGQFRDGQATHPIGRAIFVFAGGTCSTFAEFCRTRWRPKMRSNNEEEEVLNHENQDMPADQEFKLAKGPDFVSRLRGYVDIKGPNPVSEDDRLYLIRRALFLRFLLEKNAKHLIYSSKKCQIDLGVLRAMIKVPEYKHGVRSMLAIIEMSMLAGRTSFEQAALPSPEQLELHVDTDVFSRLVVRDVLLGSAREILAKIIYEKYLKNQKDKKPKDDPAMAPWENLLEDLKESNRRQADHIPVKLKAIGCDFAPAVGRRPKLIKFKDEEIEIMAEMEHDRFVAERFLQEWSLGPRNPEKKTSPYLVDWKELSEEIKEYDRQAVREIPRLLAKAKFEIYRLI